MATYKCTEGNEITILQGELPEAAKKHFGIKDEKEFVCQQCGDCCMWCHIPVHPVFAADPRAPEWLKAHRSAPARRGLSLTRC